MEQKPILCIVGLGYVGLPLAHAFASHGFETYGFDINERRIDELKNGFDRTNELTEAALKSTSITFDTDPSIIGKADIVILAIPTPVDGQNKPDLTLVESASQIVGEQLRKGMIVVYESTVYPGVTEDICGPILENVSGLVSGKDFTLGYSPERINPGDKEHTVETITKIVAGQDERTLDILTEVYGSIVKAGIYRASSIKVAEMAKAIENAQRDLNIAYMNEIAMLCGKIGISTKEVLAAAGTKWNFLKFQPGLVGGHCIGVDPYYLVEKAKQLGMDTHVINAGRSINDGMGAYVADQVVAALSVPAKKAKMLVLGLTFKENVPDTRNSKVHDVISSLASKGIAVDVHDPFYPAESIRRMSLSPGGLDQAPYDAILLLVPHAEYLDISAEAYANALADTGVFYDLKGVLPRQVMEQRGKTYLSL